MHTAVLVHGDPDYTALKKSVHAGNIHILIGLPVINEIGEHARRLIRDAFAPMDPQAAQYELDVAKFAQLAGDVKASFTHHPLTDHLVVALGEALRVDPETTYFDRPRLRIVPSGDYLTSGVSYAYKPHRDTWYGHPTPVVNFWFPIFEVSDDCVMSFWPQAWQTEIANTGFDYEAWVRDHRFSAVEHIGKETRPHPLPTDEVPTWEIRPVPSVGDTIVFSTCHLHGTAPNTSGKTRFSVDLRFLTAEDIGGDDPKIPRDVDSAVVGTTLTEFRRLGDLAGYPR